MTPRQGSAAGVPASRRQFLEAVSGLAAAAACLDIGRAAHASGDDILKIGLIGCGGRGMNHLEWLVTQTKDNLLAIVDPDEKSHDKVKSWLKRKGQNPAKLQAFTDYRTMFDKLGKQVDAVFIATPNHQHAPPAMIALHHEGCG